MSVSLRTGLSAYTPRMSAPPLSPWNLSTVQSIMVGDVSQPIGQRTLYAHVEE